MKIPIDSKVDNSSELSLTFDIEWLTILRKTHHLLSTSTFNVYLPNEIPTITIEVIY